MAPALPVERECLLGWHFGPKCSAAQWSREATAQRRGSELQCPAERRTGGREYWVAQVHVKLNAGGEKARVHDRQEAIYRRLPMRIFDHQPVKAERKRNPTSAPGSAHRKEGTSRRCALLGPGIDIDIALHVAALWGAVAQGSDGSAIAVGSQRENDCMAADRLCCCNIVAYARTE